MFGHRDLLSEGVQANAIVMKTREYDMRGDSGGYDRVHLDVEIHFADGTTAAISLKAKTADVGLVDVGQILPVRYDDNDHSKVEIDVPAMKAHRAAAQDAARARDIARAEAQLAGPAAEGSTADELRNLQPGDALPTLERIRQANRKQ
jgi:hypothetical protein